MKDEQQFMQHYRNYMASECRAQLPFFNRVGRGPKGDSFSVEKITGTSGKTILIGKETQGFTGETAEAWRIDFEDEVPTVGYRLYNEIRDGYLGWWIHFRCKNEKTNTLLWEFDTPFTRIEASGETMEARIVSGSY